MKKEKDIDKKNKKSIYRSAQGKKEILDLYDSQLGRLEEPVRNLYVNTSFGKTHLIENGNLDGEPLLVFHGGNATTAYNLLTCEFLFDHFHVYAVDIIGHPGKSDETSLSAANYDYGKWTSEVITALGYKRMNLFGGSFGAGVIAKTMCVAPEKVKRVVMVIPSGIKNAMQLKNAKMMFPMIMYWITKKDKWLKKTMMPLAITEDNITDDIYETAKLSIDHMRVKVAMPTNVSASKMKNCKAPTLVMAAEKDCLFPGLGVLRRAKRIIPKCKTYMIRDRGHMHFLTDDEKKMIVNFLLGKSRNA